MYEFYLEEPGVPPHKLALYNHAVQMWLYTV